MSTAKVSVISEGSTIDCFHHKAESTLCFILLHPWNMLGGSVNDFIVQIVAKHIQRLGHNVVRYQSNRTYTSSAIKDLESLINHFSKEYTVRLVAYSHGAVVASQFTAPKLLISLPIRFLWFFLGYDQVRNRISQADWMITGNQDLFCTVSNFVEFTNGITTKTKIIETCDHFYSDEANIEELLMFVSEFVDTQKNLL
jgi:alpha/beta superfamily hydrolase